MTRSITLTKLFLGDTCYK